jgi:hypothetical protein
VRPFGKALDESRDKKRIRKMRKWIYLTAGVALSALFTLGQANALPVGNVPSAISSPIVEAQFIFGGRNYCWYDAGWRGPGYYWCGYAMRRGLGWGGAAGWHGWAHGGGRPHGGRPGGGHGGHGGGHHH